MASSEIILTILIEDKNKVEKNFNSIEEALYEFGNVLQNESNLETIYMVIDGRVYAHYDKDGLV